MSADSIKCIEMLAKVRRRVHDFVSNLFDMIDVNGDGIIDKDELRVQMERGFEPLPPDMAKGMDKEA